jgi:DNA phosphorothioation-dependent restriction protein DptG
MDSQEINKMYNNYTITVFKYIHTIPYINVCSGEKSTKQPLHDYINFQDIMELVKMHFQHNVSGTLCPLPKYYM